jgi:hypothetical protein
MTKKQMEMCTKTSKSAKFQTGMRGQKTQVTGRSLFWRQRSALDCSAIKEAVDIEGFTGFMLWPKSANAVS